jgi:3-phosphoshikimate 1-carboxyvinyltransferase
MAALADGLTKITHPLVARETEVMIDACRALGAKVSRFDDRLEVAGIGPASGGQPAALAGPGSRYIWASGSALVARLFLTIGSALPEAVIVDGKCNLRVRPFSPLFAELRRNGVEFRFPDMDGHLPCVATSVTLPGGSYELGTEISSQFATALAISAPLAESTTRIDLTGPSYSTSYIRQTLDMMAHFGVSTTVEGGADSGGGGTTGDDVRRITVPGGRPYRSRDVEISGDYTSVSYLLGAALVTRGTVTVAGLDPDSLQGERAIVGILAGMGAGIRWLPGGTLVVDCAGVPSEVDAAFDLSDCPNILPTVAAMAATVPGRVRITGGRLTQNHKSPRIHAIAEELAKAGVPVRIIVDPGGFVDGLEVRGRREHDGGAEFTDHHDHRIFMAMAMYSLACRKPCWFSTEPDTEDSFPGFLDYFGFRAE